MFLLDSLVIGGLRFILSQIATAVDAELDEETVLREDLLAAQMRLELGEIGEEEYGEIERDLLQRIRAVRQSAGEGAPSPGGFKVTGVEAAFAGEEHIAGEQETEGEPRRTSIGIGASRRKA